MQICLDLLGSSRYIAEHWGGAAFALLMGSHKRPRADIMRSADAVLSSVASRLTGWQGGLHVGQRRLAPEGMKHPIGDDISVGDRARVRCGEKQPHV
jgi:hypothetical protein